MYGCGDVDQSGETDTKDVQCTSSVALWQSEGGNGPLPGCVGDQQTQADLNCDGTINTADVVLARKYALGQSLSNEMDPNRNGVPDGCELMFSIGSCPGVLTP